MRKRMENGDDIRPTRWFGTVTEISERVARTEDVIRTIYRDAFWRGLMWGLAIESALVIAAIVIGFN
jgi:hypothetical protein